MTHLVNNRHYIDKTSKLTVSYKFPPNLPYGSTIPLLYIAEANRSTHQETQPLCTEKV